MPKPGKPKPRLHGKGFKTSEDGKETYAAISGKIEYCNYDLSVVNVYDVNGNLDMSMGNIDFNGDVNITGSVRSGVTVHAMGSIYVGGFVEGATLIAGKDIVLKEKSRQGEIYQADFLRIQRLLPKETYSVIIFLTAGCLHMAGYLLRDQ